MGVGGERPREGGEHEGGEELEVPKFMEFTEHLIGGIGDCESGREELVRP